MEVPKVTETGKSWFLIIHIRVLFYLQVCSYGQISMQIRKTASFRADIRASWAPVKYSQNVCQISSAEAIGDSLLQGMDVPSADLIWCLGRFAAHWAVEFRIPQKDHWGLSELLIPLGSSDSARGVLKHSWMIAWLSWWGCRTWGSQMVSRQAGGAVCAGGTKASSILWGVKIGRARRWRTEEFIPLWWAHIRTIRDTVSSFGRCQPNARLVVDPRAVKTGAVVPGGEVPWGWDLMGLR